MCNYDSRPQAEFRNTRRELNKALSIEIHRTFYASKVRSFVKLHKVHFCNSVSLCDTWIGLDYSGWARCTLTQVN